ncbi:uncharacterized protein LOC119548666 [Drosophila subpulchrella]|uniref:uncharacterized protein LOC119548666 n=1 Tax=Drosophila subpulchrella TaxID=1486046 RepID=UPI0018A19EED|nr:uncharacterized protein LOC119548666 [Drosophila subpulchrella]XP_037712024.1 uncharacterized protein LOC119548666 [Drosophila subpulchrella]XP_037712025.1 uncharacterized protein LOC119548666 [Drosophila subpulchrella]XP_037712026.1 uncharacterized protein LOC119548666 [Drosophila subpulchrella]
MTLVRLSTTIWLIWLLPAAVLPLQTDAAHAHAAFPLPAVPLPPPPPFSPGQNQFAFNAFAGQHASGGGGHAPASSPGCGGMLKERHGIIQTPNFPHRFGTPIECVWIIDASDMPPQGQGNVSIVVYLTQLYVLSGLKFTEYMYYSDDFKVPAHRVFTLTEDDVTQVTWVQFHSQYLEIRFTMATLDGTHLRALDRLLDVYGFNITYEVQNEVKTAQCNALQCRFLGDCFASSDFSSYGCSCFPGFSGSDCGHGPLCKDLHTNVCQNGGTCKHIGDAAITCHCPKGFKGTRCEIPEINETTQGCTSNTSSIECHQACDFDNFRSPSSGSGSSSAYSAFKSNRNTARSGKTRYEVTMRLGANLTGYYRHADREQLSGVMERQLGRVLRNFNITKISDLELISNSTDRLDITFHFFGVKGDSQRIRDAITRMVERGRIGNFTLVANFHHFDENPPLGLLELTVNQPQSGVREASEFIISCTAQGSSRMQFQWFKDGAVVNATRATREIWTTVLPPETKDVYTAILGVTKASRIDEGVYSCKVTDWGVEQCRSLHIHIKSPPRLRVDPASVTLQRGDSLRVRCLSPGNDDIKRYAQLGYSWTRNGVLFQSDAATAMWEDLYPDGSILKINNIQKSAEYACLVSNSVRPVSRSVYINVIERNAVHVCPTESTYGVHWPTSAPGAPIITDCPRGFEGHLRRICEQRDTGNSTWLLPDFSGCVRDELLLIYNRFLALSAGFQQTNSSNILKACFDFTLQRRHSFLPGEASFLIDMLHELDTYLQLKGTQLEREMAAEIILRILDKVMQNAQSLNSQQQIKKLQQLTQSAALNRETIAASQLATSTSGSSQGQPAAGDDGSGSGVTAGEISAAPAGSLQATRAGSGGGGTAAGSAAGAGAGASSILTVDEDTLSLDRLNSLRIYMTSVKTLPFNLRIYGEDLFSDQLYMDIGLSARLLHIMANSTIFASVISYKNLKSFLPKTYYTRGSDPRDSDYVLASRIIQTWLFQSNRSNDNFREPLDLPFEAGHVEIIFQHESVPKSGDWVAVCGHDYKASFDSTWRSDLCITKHLMANITRCICPLSGTYVVMLTKRQPNATPSQVPQRPIFVIASCACCLLQCGSALLILAPIWCNRKCAVTFLKMQFCVSTSSVMLIYLLGFMKMLPVSWHGIISSSLASLLLLGISTLIAIALAIHTELMPQKYLQIGSKPATPTKRRLERERERDLESLSNITQIRAQSPLGGATTTSNPGQRRLPPTISSAAGMRGAIGISWLLPLLFAVAGPLICSIIGQWPRHWWLEVLRTGSTFPEAHNAGKEESAYSSHSLLNGDNLLLESEALMGNGTSSPPTETSSSALDDEVATTMSTSSITGLGTASSSGFTTATSVSALAAPLTSGLSEASPSLSFILFICIDLLFILLFSALFAILMKKLLWLWHKNRNVHTHPLDKFNLALQRRFGLLYRAGGLLLAKISSDGLFIVYVNSSPETDTLWAYPFGISCILLGSAILICFVIRAESQLRGPPFLGSNGSSQNSSLKQAKFNTSRSSLDENYCTTTTTTTTTANVNSPLSFYTNHDKEKENDCAVSLSMSNAGVSSATGGSLATSAGPGAPPLQSKVGLELSGAPCSVSGSGVAVPLTIISTAPRCQAGADGAAESFLGDRQTLSVAPSPDTRCCAILGGGTAYDAYTMGMGMDVGGGMAMGMGVGGLTGSLGRRTLHHQPTHYRPGPCGEFVGVETLDILQGVAADSIIGIHTSAIMPNATGTSHYVPLQHNPYVDFVPSSLILSMAPPPTISGNLSGAGIPAIPAMSLPTQTPKTQKRVTILEPTSRTTFDPLLPTMVSMAVVTTSSVTSTATTTPATPTSTQSGCGGNDATLDRITLDLDYLLNRGVVDGTDGGGNGPPPSSTEDSQQKQ